MGPGRPEPASSPRDQFSYELSLGGREFVRDLIGWTEVVSGEIPSPDEIHTLEQHMYVRLVGDDVTTREPQLLLDRARQAQLLGHYRRVERLCRSCLAVQPGHEGARAMMSSALRAMHRSADALKVTDEFNQSSYVPLLTSRAAALCDLRRWDEAEETIQRAIGIRADEMAVAVLWRIERRKQTPSILPGEAPWADRAFK